MRDKLPEICATAVALILFYSCSSTIPRTKWTDKGMRVMVDPDSISSDEYVQITNALVRTGKFVVVDRAAGLEAAKKEQERLHRNETDRFDDREKFAWWGRLYGVGAIVTAHSQCVQKPSFWNPSAVKLVCSQYLWLVDSNTAEVIVAVKGENDGPSTTDLAFRKMPDFDETVDKLVAAYPRDYKPVENAESLRHYQDVSKEEALRQKERVLDQQRAPAGAGSVSPEPTP